MRRDLEPTIALIGMGAMGMGMARSILRAGLSITGYDVNPAALTAFVEAGGQVGPSAAETARGADVLVVVVLNQSQAEDVLFGAGQAAAALEPGSVVMLCSTVPPAYARSTAARLAEMGLEMLDAPISGGAARAATGELSVMAAGAESVFARCQPVLDAVAAHVYPMGDQCGLGSVMKSVNQLLAGVHIATAAEAMAYAVRAGLDADAVYEVICNSAGGSWMFENRVPHMISGDFTPLSAVNIWLKDLDIVLQTGKELNMGLPLAALAHQLFLMAAGAGHGRLDDAAVVKVYEELSGAQVSRSV